MTLEQYLEDRETWQNSTVEEIRKELINKPAFIKRNNAGEKLVAIYGPPQIGKTTLILCLLRIDPQYQKKVYDTIRAGVPKGNSSTSTAIIYQRNDSDHYGVRYGESMTGIELCTEAELQDKIREIRTSVENDSASKDILHIYIPKHYFLNAASIESELNIVDLPGEGSRNIKETAHVDAMISKYMALATVNIIVCKANEIKSLETLQLPINVDWRNLPHKYIVVITNAFGMGTIKDFFKTEKGERKQTFYEFVKQSYKQEITQIIGSLSQIEYFPIDIGDSYEKVINSCGLDEEDREEVKKVRESITNEIYQSIHQRQGNSLKTTMLDLKNYSTEYVQDKCEGLRGKVAELIDEEEMLQKDLKTKVKIVAMCEDKISELQFYRDKYDQLAQYNVTIDVRSVEENVEQIVSRFSKNGKIKDLDQKILSKISDVLVKLISNTFEAYHLPHNATKDDIALYEQINMDIDLEATVGDKLYKGGWFKTNTKQEEFEDLLSNLITDFCERLKLRMLDILNTGKSEIKEYYDDYDRYRQLKKESERGITKNEERIVQIDKDLYGLNAEIEAIEARTRADKKIIDDYLDIAKIEYDKYKSTMLKLLDSEDYSVEEKVMMIIYLCMLEKDYQSITEMG